MSDAADRVEQVAAEACSTLDGKAPESTDFANYFCTYAFLYHQKDMLEDHKRTGAYYSAVMSNRRQFHDKVVLDVGTGSGILAIFAAKAGAKKVYAVEATAMALSARKLVKANKLDNIIEVIQGTIETIQLPEQVDIIISEWMGYFLLRESMLDSVLVARDKFLKPGGAMYPSHANMYMVPIRTRTAQQRVDDMQNSMEGWAQFVGEMRQFYDVDLNVLSDAFRDEQRDYYMSSAQWTDIHPSQMLGSPTVFKRYDLHTLTLQELQAPMQAHFAMHVADGGPVEAFTGFFDVLFKGSESSPADNEVRLTTAPDPTGATHWGQHTFYLNPPIDCAPGDRLETDIIVARQKENHRLLQVQLAVKTEGSSIYAQESRNPRMCRFKIE